MAKITKGTTMPKITSVSTCDICGRSQSIELSSSDLEELPDLWRYVEITIKNKFRRSSDDYTRPNYFIVCNECIPPSRDKYFAELGKDVFKKIFNKVFNMKYLK